MREGSTNEKEWEREITDMRMKEEKGEETAKH